MKIRLAVLDWQRADLRMRESFAFSRHDIPALLQRITAPDEVLGAVLLLTCNRTELCVSLAEGSVLSPGKLLCEAAGIPYGPYADAFSFAEDLEVLEHLYYLCAGMESQIFGDGQIITQVKDALSLSSHAGCTDPVLQTLYRIAVTGGKRVRTELDLTLSAAGAAAETAKRLSGLDVHKVLVIGNGEIGRETAAALVQAGISVTVTLRRYKYAQNVVPAGCASIPYEQRYTKLGEFDAVVSATASPHHTITAEEFAKCERKPRILIDLAVPRDIDPACDALVVTIDELGSRERTAQMEALREKAGELYPKYRGDFLRWEKRRNAANKPGRFPLFIDITDRKVLVVGAGRIACRRILTLCQFGCRVEVVAPECCEQVSELAKEGKIAFKQREFTESDLIHAVLAVTATSNREVNRRVGELCHAKGIPVSVADCREECSFYFPAVVQTPDAVIGLCGDGSDHAAVARMAQEIRDGLQE